MKLEQIWNCDKSSFPTDPSKCKVVTPIETPGYKTTPGAERENYTALETCGAAGRALDLLILFFKAEKFKLHGKVRNLIWHMYLMYQ